MRWTNHLFPEIRLPTRILSHFSTEHCSGFRLGGRFRACALLCFILSSGLLRSASGAILRVKQYTTPPSFPNGASWSTAYPSLDAALAVASTNDQIWVASTVGVGMYTPTGNQTGGDGNTRHFEIAINVVIRGGYPTNPSNGTTARDVATNVTAFSGDFDGDDPAFGTSPADPDFLNNAYRVFEVVDVSDSCVIDGVVIRDGHNWNGEEPEVGDPGFLGFGGGMRLSSANDGEFATPYIQNCKFLDNFASRQGGALIAAPIPIEHVCEGGSCEDPEDYTSLLKIRTCEFRGNIAHNETGGAIDMSRSGLDIAGTLVADNHANAYGSGIHIFFPTPLIITNCTITNNNNSHSSAGVACSRSDWQPPDPEGTEPPLGLFVVKNSIISGNRDDQPGGGSGSFDNQLGGAKYGYPIKPELDFSIVYDSVGVVGVPPFGAGNQTTPAFDPAFFVDRSNGNVFARNYKVVRLSRCRGPIDLASPDLGVLPADEKDADDDSNTMEPLPDVRLNERVLPGIDGFWPCVDIGAYEMLNEEIDVPPFCVEDLDENEDVDSADLAILLGAWSAECNCADLDADGSVGASDLAILLGAWGPCVPSSAARSSQSNGGESGLRPATLASSLGFESIESFANWLALLDSEARLAVLSPLGE